MDMPLGTTVPQVRQRRASLRACAAVGFRRAGLDSKRPATSAACWAGWVLWRSRSRALPATSGRSKASRKLPSPSEGGRSSAWTGLLGRSNSDVAFSNPGAVDAELGVGFGDVEAARAHLGHFKRLPGLTLGGRLRMTPQCLHWMVWGITGLSPRPGGRVLRFQRDGSRSIAATGCGRIGLSYPNDQLASM